jgi:hypothetical protein
MVFAPTANGTDILNRVLQGNLNPAIKHSSPVSCAVPLPAELLQVTEVAVAERDPDTVTVSAHIWPVFCWGFDRYQSGDFAWPSSSPPPPPQALSPRSSGASTAESHCFRQLLVLAMLLSL